MGATSLDADGTSACAEGQTQLARSAFCIDKPGCWVRPCVEGEALAVRTQSAELRGTSSTPYGGLFTGGLEEDFQRRSNGNKSPTEELRRESPESESAYRGHVPKTVC